MIKTLGVVLFSLSVFLFGYMKSCDIAKDRKYMEAFLKLVFYIRSRVSSENMSLPAIYSKFSDSELEKTGFLPSLREKKTHSALYETVKEFERILRLDSEFYGMLADFSADVGKCVTKAECEKYCEKYISYMKNMLDMTEKETAARVDIIRKLSALSACLFAILLF